MRKSTLAALLASAIVAGTLAAAGPAVAQPAADSADVIRVAGDNRIETAVRASQAFFYGEGEEGEDDFFADAVVLARADSFADAAAGGPLAYAKGGPLLLTPSNGLHPDVAAEIERILPNGNETVYLLGGTKSLSAGVESAVKQLGYKTVRLGGADRYETSVLIAKEIGTGDDAPELLMLATGLNFPDALTAGAAAGAYGGAVLLTAGNVLPKSVRDYLISRDDAEVFTVGGPAIAALPGTGFYRIAGANRYETAAKVADIFFEEPDVVAVASGADFPDALSISALMPLVGGPVLLTEPSSLPKPTSDYLTAGKSTIQFAYVLGGPQSVSKAVEAKITEILTK
jgi:putative cell wall-binding protein